jgi:hypothetical protein
MPARGRRTRLRVTGFRVGATALAFELVGSGPVGLVAVARRRR